MELAYLAAFGCALCYGAGSVLQSVGARRVAASDRLDPVLLARVARQAPYAAGLGLDLVGWVLSLLALQRLPLFAVQAVLASSVGVTVVLAAAFLHLRPNQRQVAALVALGLGLVLLAATAAPDRPRPVGGGMTLSLWLAMLAIGAAAVLAARTLRGERAGALLGGLSGLAFGGTAVCARALEAGGSLLSVLADPLAWALVGYGTLGIALFAAALQQGSVTVATACQYTAETVVPTVVGLALLGDHARGGLSPLAAAGFAVTVGAALALTAVSPPLESAPAPALAADRD